MAIQSQNIVYTLATSQLNPIRATLKIYSEIMENWPTLTSKIEVNKSIFALLNLNPLALLKTQCMN